MNSSQSALNEISNKLSDAVNDGIVSVADAVVAGKLDAFALAARAPIRVSGQTISLNGISSGSFQVTGATRYRIKCSLFTIGGLTLLVGYNPQLSLASASWTAINREEISDDVPEGTTVYWKTVDPSDFTDFAGGDFDVISVSYYG